MQHKASGYSCMGGARVEEAKLGMADTIFVRGWSV
jgi:hypothetical protein